MGYCKVNDATIYYEYIPSNNPNAETIIFGHGLGLDSTTWKLIIPYLQDFHLLTFDFRDHGRTRSTSSEISWDILYKDFKELLNFLKIKHYHYVGHGLGGLFGVELFGTFGEKASSFSLLSTPCYYPKNVAQKGIEFRKKMLFSHFDNFVDFMIPQILYDRTNRKCQLIKEAYSRSNLARYIDWLKFIEQSLSLKKLGRITIPTLVLIGEFDINYPPSLITINANYFPQCKMYIIHEASNVIFVDQPKLVSEHLRIFFSKNRHFSIDQKSALVCHI
ncbi:putative aminoacrylate hydrolase RutD [Anoxybacillus sp. BCO1]|nr:putative aminoacrylate hydrolase RutD [Anoxybacillus sp. BCO1]